jgi:hypothetical protein
MLLTESLDPVRREHTHQHIESCPLCSEEWTAYQETWRTLELLPEVPVPARVKERFLAQVNAQAKPDNVVPFTRRPVLKWIAQAAAVVLIAGGSYFAGHRTQPVIVQNTPATLTNVQPIAAQKYSIAESRVLPASLINPDIEGRPDIQNVTFDRASTGNDDQIQLAFDITSHVTVTGRPTDKSMVHLTRYVLENEDQLGPSRSRAIDWVRQTYSRPGNADPEIATALANVLRNDEHQGVRIKAADTLRTLTPSAASASDTRDALIEALKTDPNPAVRIKAVEALAKLASSGATLDAATLDTLRQKALQPDENAYVRLKAAEALSAVKP